jgi:hypothetical protein
VGTYQYFSKYCRQQLIILVPAARHHRLSFGYPVYYRPAPVGQIGRSAHTSAGELAYRLNTVRSVYDLAYDCHTTRYAANMPYPDTVMLYCVIWHTDVQEQLPAPG